ncbi:hypothetical protein LCGC14_3134430, partial [marine sediment metagenome]
VRHRLEGDDSVNMEGCPCGPETYPAPDIDHGPVPL